MIDTTIDGHVHTKLCHHAVGEMEEYVQAAVNRGLAGITFLEHLELDIRYFETTWLSEDDFNYYIKEGNRLKEKYRKDISVGIGIEVGYNPDRVHDILEFLKRYKWDRVGMSYHFLETGDDLHLNMVSSKKRNLVAAREFGPEKIITAYYRGLCDAVNSLPGTVLCHLDAVLRHLPEVTFTSEHELLIDKLLNAVSQKQMALEINTSGFVKRNEPYPSIKYIAAAVKKGIKLVAGSDSHHPDQVGRFFDRARSLVASL